MSRRPFRLPESENQAQSQEPMVLTPQELFDEHDDLLSFLFSVVHIVISEIDRSGIDDYEQEQLASNYLQGWLHYSGELDFDTRDHNHLLSLVTFLIALHIDQVSRSTPLAESYTDPDSIIALARDLTEVLLTDESSTENQIEFLEESISEWFERRNPDYLSRAAIQLLADCIFEVVEIISELREANQPTGETQSDEQAGTVWVTEYGTFFPSLHPNHNLVQATFSNSELHLVTGLGLTLEEVYENVTGAENIKKAAERFDRNTDSWRVKLENLRQFALDYELDGVCSESKHEFVSLLNLEVALEDLKRFLDHFNEIDLLMIYRHLSENEQMDNWQIQNWFSQSNDQHFELVAKLRQNATLEETTAYRTWIRQVKQDHGLTTGISPETIDFVESKEQEPFSAHLRPPIGTELELNDKKERSNLINVHHIIESISDIPANPGWAEYAPPPCYSPEMLIAIYNFLYDSGLMDKYPTTQHDNVGWVQSFTLSALNIVYLQLTGYCWLPYFYDEEYEEEVYLQLFYHEEKRYFGFGGYFESKDSTNCHPQHFAKQTVLRARLASAQHAYEQVLKNRFRLEGIDEIASSIPYSFDTKVSDRVKRRKWKGETISDAPILTEEEIRQAKLSEEVLKLATTYAYFLKQMKQFLDDLDLSMSDTGHLPRPQTKAVFSQILEAYPDVASHYDEQRLDSVASSHIVVRAQQLGKQVVEEVEEIFDSLEIKFLKFLEVFLSLKENVLDSDQHPEDFKLKKLSDFVNEFMSNFPAAIADNSTGLAEDEWLKQASLQLEKLADRYL